MSSRFNFKKYEEMKNKVKHEVRILPDEDIFKKEWTETCEKVRALLGAGGVIPKKKEKNVIHVPNRSLKGSALR